MAQDMCGRGLGEYPASEYLLDLPYPGRGAADIRLDNQIS
jgi:hypothetical protein